MDNDGLIEILKDAPAPVRNCAMVDAVFYERGGCTLASTHQCPFQSSKYKVQVDGQSVPACERYHPKLQKK